MNQGELFPSEQDTIELRNALGALVKSQGWQILKKIMTRQRDNHINICLRSPIGTEIDGHTLTVYNQEFTKGQIAGIETVLGMPDILIQDANLTLTKEQHDE